MPAIEVTGRDRGATNMYDRQRGDAVRASARRSDSGHNFVFDHIVQSHVCHRLPGHLRLRLNE